MAEGMFPQISDEAIKQAGGIAEWLAKNKDRLAAAVKNIAGWLFPSSGKSPLLIIGPGGVGKPVPLT